MLQSLHRDGDVFTRTLLGIGCDVVNMSTEDSGNGKALLSEEEKLEAHGNSFFYDAKTSTATLKGSPEMWAIKEGNVLHAVDMTIQNEKADPKNPAAKSFQKATAKGPGWIDITEKDKDKKEEE